MRTSTWLNYAVCVLALGVYAWSFQGQQELGALPPGAAALKFSATAIAGTPITGKPARKSGQVDFLIQRYRPGTHVQVESGAVISDVITVRKFSSFHLWITFISGFFFWCIAIFVFAGRLHVEWARVLFWGTLSYGLAVTVGGIYCPPPPLWPGAFRPLLRMAAVMFTAAMFVHLGLVFPYRRGLESRPWLLHGLYALSAAFVIWQGGTLIRYLEAPGPVAWRGLRAASTIADIYLVVIVVTGGMLLSRSLREAQLTRERQQAKWVWWGITVGVSPYLFLYTVPRLLGIHELMPLAFARLFAIVVPAAFAIAVARYQFMDIDIIIRRSLIYGALAGMLMIIYLVPALLILQKIVRVMPQAALYAPVAAALTSVALFGLTRRSIGLWVDRTFFKIRYDYDQALQSFQKSVSGTSGQEELAALVHTFLMRTFSPKSAAVVIRAGQNLLVSGTLEPHAVEERTHDIEQLPGGGDMPVAAVGATSLPEIERNDFPVDGNGRNVVLAQPLVRGAQRFGFILLGEKESERRYIEQDLELLAAMASAAAAALERIDLVQKVAEERFFRDQLDVVNREKTKFLNTVAHDLKGPLASISASTENLLDEVIGPVACKQRVYLERTRLTTRHLTRLVDSLLEMARLEDGRSPAEASPVRLAPVLEEAIDMVQPIAENREVRIRADCEPGLGCVRGDRGKLLRIMVNLLDNAIKYSPAGGEVSITLRRGSPGEQDLAIRDQGPGIAPGDEEKIFEMYRQGTHGRHLRPQGQGFGVGLYVVKLLVEMFGGTVMVANNPEGGACFTCRLPEWSTSGEATA